MRKDPDAAAEHEQPPGQRRGEFNDEWYNLEPMPSPLVRILAEVDTDTLDPIGGGVHP